MNCLPVFLIALLLIAYSSQVAETSTDRAPPIDGPPRRQPTLDAKMDNMTEMLQSMHATMTKRLDEAPEICCSIFLSCCK
nr:conotoxin precursor T [Conus ebraeus]DAZ85919.1 TPA_inf: conotoxin precursor T [Conus ebraeus]